MHKTVNEKLAGITALASRDARTRSQTAGDRLGKRRRAAGTAQIRRQRILRLQRGDDGLAQALGVLDLAEVVEQRG